MQIFQAESSKAMPHFVDDFTRVATQKGFLIHNEDKMEMAHTFGRHGTEVAADFDLHMIQVCKPEKAAISLGKNPERAVLMPKFVIAFSDKGKTQIRFLHYSRSSVRQLVDDNEFPASLEASFHEIIGAIEEAK